MRSIPTRLESFAVALACAAVATVMLPFGCTGGLRAPLPDADDGDTAPRRGGTLRLASVNDIYNLDPAGPTDGLASQALTLLFDGLIDFDRTGQIIPNLAEHWQIEDEGRSYRFHLRAGVRMHDGGELTADDVKRSVERALHPTTPCPTASNFEDLIGYQLYTTGSAPHLTGVTVDGRYDVTFQLARPDGAFLALLALPSMRPVCATAGDRYADTWLPCGAGPFKLEPGGWARGTSLRIVRHDTYFRPGLPYLDAVEWTYGMNVVPQRFRFEDGELDMLLNPTQADVGRFAADARWKGLSVTLVDNVVWGEAMNTRVAPFDNVEVRRAVAAAVDREHLAMIKPANVSPLTQLLPRGVPGFDPSFEGQRHDVAAALEHMRKAGYPYDPATGRGGWSRPIPYDVFDQGFETSSAQVLQQDLARIGLRLELRIMAWTAWQAITARAGASAMHPQGDSADYADPSTFFDHLFTTSAIRDEGTSNTAFYSNPRYDDLVARARRTVDADVRRALYHEADEILCDEAPWAFSHGQHDYVMRQPYVRGFEPHPVWPFDVRRVWLDRADAAMPRPLSGGLR
jgi:ABC-type transport system substrate-binding protein